MGGACSTYGEEKSYMNFLCGYLRVKDQLEDPDVDGRILLKWIFRKRDMGAWT